jgi:hypothetical protein
MVISYEAMRHESLTRARPANVGTFTLCVNRQERNADGTLGEEPREAGGKRQKNE